MFSRIRIAIGLALLLTLLTFIAAYAKGNFSFITIQGPDIKGPVRVTDPALTTDWFAFADFSRGKVDPPANPGASYEITRYYIDQGREQAFDRLHYYPDTGFVYYDGIVGGWSEYDGKWYAAQSGIEATFKNVLVKAIQAQPGIAANQSAGSSQSEIDATQPVAPLAITAGLAVILVLAFWLRKPSPH
jgi:hypothetical protein